MNIKHIMVEGRVRILIRNGGNFVVRIVDRARADRPSLEPQHCRATLPRRLWIGEDDSVRRYLTQPNLTTGYKTASKIEPV